MTTNHEQLKFTWDSYFSLTPKRMQRLGIAIKGLGITISSSSIVGSLYADNKTLLYVALGSVILQAIAEFIIQFFTMDPVKPNGVNT